MVVLDVPHDLLHDVLDRHDALAASVLVDHDGELETLALHLGEEVADPLGRRDVVGRPREVLHRVALRPAVEDVESGHDADHVVDPLPVDGEP